MNALVLVVDDQEPNRRLLCDLLAVHGYRAESVCSGAAALRELETLRFDLVLLDVMMPEMNGFDVLRRIRATEALSHLPVILCTSLDPESERVTGLDAGADDFLQKPINRAELLARVRSLLRIKNLFDQLREKQLALYELNATLEARIVERSNEVMRLSRLKRFFSSKLVDKIVAGGADDPLISHRRDIAVVFVDLRGFTAFAESATAAEVMRVLSEYHAMIGRFIEDSGGTIERFAGDGIMVFFNDPELLENPCRIALQFAHDVVQASTAMSTHWTAFGYSLGIGVGAAYGPATLGAIGYSGRIDYGAIGGVTNLAARLCAEADAGEVIVHVPVFESAGILCGHLPTQLLALKGFREQIKTIRLDVDEFKDSLMEQGGQGGRATVII